MARVFLLIVAGTISLILLAAVLLSVFWEDAQRIALERMKPTTSFADAILPPAPDYARADTWAARPGADADVRVRPEAIAAAESLPVDVFFIHPTTYLGTAYWNAPLDEASAAATIPYVLRVQASPFAAGRVFAPRYRQVAFGAFLAGNKDMLRAISIAYEDVEAAFDLFIAGENAGRPFILAGHSQGALLGTMLLAARIAGTPLAERMVAAYLPGWPLSLAEDIGSLAGIDACAGAEETGCVVGWQTFAADGEPDYLIETYVHQTGLSGRPKADTPMLCVNPLSWSLDTKLEPPSRHLGAVGPADRRTGRLPAPIPQMLEARCASDGFLRVAPPPGPPFTDFLLPGGNYHVYDIHLFYMNLRANVADRVRAWIAATGRP